MVLLNADNQDKKSINEFFKNPHVLDTPKATDLNEPPEATRIETTLYRILRDTALSREVKIRQNYQCQICSETVPLGDGSYYAEAHHIKPLERPYNGPDTIDNIICVCPMCHVLLDYKAIKLEKLNLPNVSSEYVEFHNREIYGKY